MAVFHPRNDEHGKPVALKTPSVATPLGSWLQADTVACVVPDGSMPAQLHGVPIVSWQDAPTSDAGWEALASQSAIAEPPFVAPAGYRKSAGVVVREPDGRYWVVAPSNAYGGYPATFPKGKLEGKSAQATALVETFEESGLRVRLLAHLTDVKRSTSYTRYYLAERLGGNPAEMGWESQAVMLVPSAHLYQVLTNKNDHPILEALNAGPANP